MPIRDVTARNRSLDNDYGPTAGPNAAESHVLALYTSDPMTDPAAAEVTGGGYRRAPVPPSAWQAAAEGFKTLTAPAEFPATGEWSDTVTYWALLDPGGIMWDTGALADPLDVTGPGEPATVHVVVFYDDSALDQEEG